MKRTICLYIILNLLASLAIPIPKGYAQEPLRLPAVGSMVELSQAYAPVLIKGLQVHPQNPLMFDFILDTGRSDLQINSPAFRSESEKLIKYFLTSLTVKEEDLWVNLSPYEKNRVIPEGLGKTAMGQEMLAQDYILKQLTASLIYPEKELGKKFWDNVYTKSQQIFGTTALPVDTFNKVWIVADSAKVLERGNVAYVTKAHLKVMLEEDYLAQQKHQVLSGKNTSAASQIIKEIVIPAIEKEVNEGSHFAPLRQIYYSMILATWYKQVLKQALLNQVYSDQGLTSGVLSDDPRSKDKIFEQYLKAYKKGVFNYIKDDLDQVSQQRVPRKYFAGGEFLVGLSKVLQRSPQADPGELAQLQTGSMAMATVNVAKQEGAKGLLNSAMTSLPEELPAIAQLPDLDAIKYYNQMLARDPPESERQSYQYFLDARKESLWARLKGTAQDVSAPLRRMQYLLRGDLIAENSDEMNRNDFMEQHLLPQVQQAQEKGKAAFIIAASGEHASGKTVVTDYFETRLRAKNVPWIIKSASVDDWLFEKEDRVPVDTEDPYQKYKVSSYKEFMRLLSLDQRATKPIYDQKSKGQLKFGLDEEGQLTLFSGNVEMVIGFSNGTITYEIFQVKRDDKGRRAGRIKTETQGSIDNSARQMVTLGSLPITIEPMAENKGVRIHIKEAGFDLEHSSGAWVLKVTGEKDKALSKERKEEALEVWESTEGDPSKRRIVIMEGILALTAFEHADLSANIKVATPVRRVRSMTREWSRGRQGASLDAQHAATLTIREITEDKIIAELNAEAAKKNGAGARVQTHFQINNMTLEEQIFDNYLFGRIRPRHKRNFIREGLDLEAIIQRMKTVEREAITTWIRDVIREQGDVPFQTPRPFPGESLSAEDELTRYWRGDFRTLEFGRFLSLKFQLQGSQGGLPAQAEERLRELLDRTQGLVTGSRVLDLGGDDISITFLNRLHEVQGQATQVKLNKVMLMNQLRYMEGILNDIARRYEEAGGDSVPEAQAILAEGQHWIDDFFRVQRALIDLGIIDTAPEFTRRYGLGFYDEKAVVLGVALGSYRMDKDALDEFARISQAEDESRGNGYMRTLIDRYSQVPGIQDLTGFQLRLLGNSDYKEDYLQTMPAVFRGYFVAQAKNFPKELSPMSSGFGEGWARAQKEKRDRTLKNEGIASIPMDYQRLQSVSGDIGTHALDKIKRDFQTIMRQRTQEDKKGTNPVLQWLASYESSLQANSFDFLYSMVEVLRNNILSDPDWLKERSAQGVEGVYQQALQDLAGHRGGQLPLDSPWKQEVFKGVIKYALDLPDSWAAFDTGTAAASHAMKSAEGGINLNAKDMALDITAEGPAMDIKFDPAMIADFKRGDFSGVVPIIIRITPMQSVLPLLGFPARKPGMLLANGPARSS